MKKTTRNPDRLPKLLFLGGMLLTALTIVALFVGTMLLPDEKLDRFYDAMAGGNIIAVITSIFAAGASLSRSDREEDQYDNRPDLGISSSNNSCPYCNRAYDQVDDFSDSYLEPSDAPSSDY